MSVLVASVETVLVPVATDLPFTYIATLLLEFLVAVI
jgi:hypothetical protein